MCPSSNFSTNRSFIKDVGHFPLTKCLYSQYHDMFLVFWIYFYSCIAVGEEFSHFGVQCLARQQGITGNIIPTQNFLPANMINEKVNAVLNGTVSTACMLHFEVRDGPFLCTYLNNLNNIRI